MITPDKTRSCFIGLTRSDLEAIRTLLNCGHDLWLQNISSEGVEILRRLDIVMTLIHEDGTWRYRTCFEFSIKDRKGHSEDCISIKELIDETPVFVQLANIFEDRIYDRESLSRLLHDIQESPLLNKTKESLKVVLGNELRYTLGPKLSDMLQGENRGSIAEIVQTSIQSENNRIGIIAAMAAQDEPLPGYDTALAQVLVDPNKWHQSVEDPNISALRVCPGVTGYIKILSEKADPLGIAGNKQRMAELMKKGQLELYCGIGSENKLFRLEPATVAGHWSARMDMMDNLKW
jgi:hypothetical protein